MPLDDFGVGFGAGGGGLHQRGLFNTSWCGWEIPYMTYINNIIIIIRARNNIIIFIRKYEV